MNPDGSDLHRITPERFGADTPAVDPLSGNIVYSRWWLTASANPPPPSGSDRRPANYYGPPPARIIGDAVLRGTADPDFAGVNVWSLATVRPDGAGLTMFAGFGLDRELTVAYRPSLSSSPTDDQIGCQTAPENCP